MHRHLFATFHSYPSSFREDIAKKILKHLQYRPEAYRLITDNIITVVPCHIEGDHKKKFW